MTYKAFQDWYYEAEIQHLLLCEYQGNLISPPFATEMCKDYSKILIWNKNKHTYIELDLPPVTSKTNAFVEAGNSLWFIPYGIYDDFNTVVELNGTTVRYHKLEQSGKGQFYSAESNGAEIFSFPLGYEKTSYGIYIKDGVVNSVEFDRQEHVKLHMGCVYTNGCFWSMPRSDTEGYIDLVSFNGTKFERYPVPYINSNITRKYTDLIAVDKILYALPFGETAGLNDIVEFDTDTKQFRLYKIPGNDFAKKYNAAVLVGNKIIGVPYGDEYCNDSNLGIVFDILSKDITQFDIDISHGGKYRYRSGVAYKDHAYFFPAGTPSCPILKINELGVVKRLQLENTMVGRPVVYDDLLFSMCYNINTKEQFIISVDEDLNHKVEFKL
jgi:hypothetical protein